MNIDLIRFLYTKQGTFGVLIMADRAKVLTLENPWLNNRRRLSCIPTGSYVAIRHESPRFGNTFLLEDVPGRDNIVFHAGNTIVDTDGCIILGSFLGELGTRPAVLNSRVALNRFRSLTRGLQDFRLNVSNGTRPQFNGTIIPNLPQREESL